MDSVSTYIANLTDPNQKIKVGPTGNLVFKKEGDLWYAQLDSNMDENQYYSSFDATGKLLFTHEGFEFLSFFMNRRLPPGYKSVRDRKNSPAYVVNFMTGIVYKSKE